MAAAIRKSTLVLLTIILALVPFRQGQGAGPLPEGRPQLYSWKARTVTVLPNARTMRERNLHFDANGSPNIIFGLYWVYYAHFDGVQWQLEMLDDSDKYKFSHVLDFDEAGNPHISYIANEKLARGYTVKYAYKDAAGWHFETAFSSPSGGGYSVAMVLGADGYPRLAYYDNQTSNLRYAWKDAAGWHSESVDSISAYQASLVLDNLGNPHIAYIVSNVQDLKYAYKDAAGWHTTTLVTVAYVIEPSLAIDLNGYPHITYMDYYPGDLMYVYQDGTGWHTQMIDTTLYNETGRFSSLVLDSNGYEYVSHAGGEGNHDLRLTYRDAAGWHTQTLDAYGDGGWYSSLVLNSAGQPCISYYVNHLGIDMSNDGDLRYGCKGSGSFQLVTVAQGGQTGRGVSMALDAANGMHVSFIADVFDQMVYARRQGNTWVQEVLGPAKYVDDGTSLALDSQGRPHVTYLEKNDGVTVSVHYAYRGPFGWDNKVYDSSTTTSFGYPSLDVDTRDNPHFAVYSSKSSAIKYFYKNDSGWHDEILSNSASCVRVSLVLDSQNKAHIAAACGGSPASLKYFYWGASGWTNEVVDTTTSGGYPSLALDHSDRPRIAYTLYGSYLYYAEKNAGSWQITKWFIRPHLAISLALDSQDRPYINFSANDIDNHRIAYWDGNAWQFQIIDDYAHPSLSTSLAIGANDAICAAYNDQNVQGLRIAYAERPVTVLNLINGGNVPVGEPVTFGAASDGGCDVDYIWDFGDGQTGNGVPVDHSYAVPGIFTVSLKAITDSTVVLTTTQVTIYQPQPPTYMPFVLRPAQSSGQ